MNKRTLLLLAVILSLAALLLWRPLLVQRDEEPAVTSDQMVPDFVAEGLRTRIFETDGRLAHQLFADRMEHFSLSNVTLLTNPEYISFLAQAPEAAGTQWQINAESGQFFNDERLTLETNVLIRNLSGVGYVEQIETEQLHIDLQTQLLYTEAPVTIRGSQFEMHGNGMHVDLDAQQVELIEHVQTIYYPRQQNESQ